MGSALPRSNTDSQGPWYDHDQYPTMNRGHSSSVSSAVPLSMAQGPNRQRNGFASNGEKAVPVPGSASYGNGMDRKNSLGGAPSLFDVARSPPNASNKSEFHPPDLWKENAENSPRYQTCTLQILPARGLSSRQRLSFLPLSRSDGPSGALQIFYEGITALSTPRVPC